ALAASAVACLAAISVFTFSYLDNRAAITAQADQLEALQAPLTEMARRPAPVETPDIDLALTAVDAVVEARTETPVGVRDLIGPSASAELALAQDDAYNHVLRNVLEPRMVALLEATMWRQIRNPD